MEKHFSIDPGKGEKMDGCPYSTFEDGHDVQEYIIPPKGYIFKGFRFEPLVNNQIYDGKLVAQYEKTTIQERLTSNLWKVLIPIFIVAVIAVVVLLAVSIFRTPKPTTPKPLKTEETIVPSDSIANIQTDTVKETDSIISEKIDATDSINQQVENQQIEDDIKQQPTIDDPNIKFKNDFWALIHQRTIMMDPYHELYVNNKDKVSGEEYDYLRFVVLKDYATFKQWYMKLHRIPVSELETINTISDLKNKLNSIE